MAEKTKCPLCSGSGNAHYVDCCDGDPIPCPRCNGTGKVSATHEFDRNIIYLQCMLAGAKREAKRQLACVSKIEKKIQKTKNERQRFLNKAKKDRK